jgi:general secretion pathway protein M
VTGTGRLPKPLRRALAVGLVVLALGSAAGLAVLPFARLAALSAEIEAATELIAQRERLLAAALVRPSHGAREALIAGDTGGLAGAELQRIVSELARRSRLSLLSAGVAAPKREADLTVIGADIALQGQLEGLRAFLHAVETGVPVLFIETLSVKASPDYRANPQPVALEITLKVKGYGAGKEAD